MIRLSAIISVACVTASAAEPLAIVADCTWNPATQTVGEFDGKGEVVYPVSVGGPFVTWATESDAGGAVLQNCDNHDYLVVVYPGDTYAADQARTVLEDMIYGSTGYTLRQMGEAVAPLGAGARLGNGDIGRCGCETIGY